MKQRSFGRSGLQVSEVVFGGGNVGGIIIHQDDAIKREAIRRAFAAGVNWIDTAAQYGNGKSEEALGWLLPESGAKPYLSTKFQLDPQQLDDIPGQIEQRLRQSLGRLKRDSVDLLQLHNRIGTRPGGRILTIEQVLGSNGVADGLDRLRAKGLIRYLGITTSFDGQYDDFVATMRRERFDFIQVDYALDNRRAGDTILPLAAERGMAVMINLPFGRGRLMRAVTGRPLPPWAAEFDVKTWPQFFLKYIVSHPAVTCAIPGMARAEYVEDNLGAARGRLPDAALRRRMEGFIDAL